MACFHTKRITRSLVPFFFFLWFFCLCGISFMLSGSILVANGEPRQSFTYKYTPALFFKDTTRFKASNNGKALPLRVFLVQKKSNWPFFPEFVTADGRLGFSLHVPGEYIVELFGIELGRFRIQKKGGELVAQPPAKIVLPFNLVVDTFKNQEIVLYDSSGKIIKRYQSDAEGRVLISETPKFMQDKVLLISKGGFPRLTLFRKIPDDKAGDYSHRFLEFKPRGKAGDLIHNVKSETYYHLYSPWRERGKAPEFWLLAYRARQKSASVRRIDLPAPLKNLTSKIFLDEKGQLIVRLVGYEAASGEKKTYAFQMNAEGSISPIEDPGSLFRFHGYLFDNSMHWRIPTFAGYPVKEGGHTLTIRCSGMLPAVNTAYEQWHERFFDLTERSKKTRDEALKILGPEPKIKPPVAGEKEQSRSFKMVYTRSKPDSLPDDGVVYDITAGRVYVGEEIYPVSDFADMTRIDQCTIRLDGFPPVPYSHKDTSLAKDCLYQDAIPVDECTANAMKNAPVIIGIDEEDHYWKGSISLLRPEFEAGGSLLNLKEGPWPELRYQVTEKRVKYPSVQEAKKHCPHPKPYRTYGKLYWSCDQYKQVKICPDNYRVDFRDGSPHIDYDALYCGKVKAKNVELALTARAKGYRESRPVFKTFPDGGKNVLITGTVRSSSGQPLPGAEVLLPDSQIIVTADQQGRYRIPPPSGRQNQVWQQDFYLISNISEVHAELKQVSPLYANGRKGRIQLTLTVDGQPYGRRRVRVDQVDIFELGGRPTKLVDQPLLFDRIFTTDAKGQVSFDLPGPEVVPGILSPRIDHRQFFPITGYLELSGEWDSDKDILVPYQVSNPFPVIEKFIVTGNIDADTWQITPSRVWIRDDDSSKFEIRVEAPGLLKVRGGEIWQNVLSTTTTQSPFAFHYKPPKIGLDLADQPDLAQLLLDTNLKAGLSIILSMLENDLLKAPPPKGKGGALFHDLDEKFLAGKLGTVKNKSLLEDLGRKWKVADSRFFVGKTPPPSLIDLFDKAKNSLTLLDRYSDVLNLQAEEKLTFLKTIDTAISFGDTIWGFLGAAHGTYTEVAKALWENTKVIYGAYRKYQDINLAYKDVIFLPIVVTVTDEQGHATQKVQKCSVRFWSKSTSK